MASFGYPYFRGNIQWDLSIKDTLGPLETVLYIEAVLNLEVIYSRTSL